MVVIHNKGKDLARLEDYKCRLLLDLLLIVLAEAEVSSVFTNCFCFLLPDYLVFVAK